CDRARHSRHRPLWRCRVHPEPAYRSPKPAAEGVTIACWLFLVALQHRAWTKNRTRTNPSSRPKFLRHAQRMKLVRKADFPVAGLGTRFLPATKAMPKEMLPVVDRPLIQIVVDEARQAGIEHFIFVTGRNKGVIEDHFDRQFELEMTLLERQKHTALDFLQ